MKKKLLFLFILLFFFFTNTPSVNAICDTNCSNLYRDLKKNNPADMTIKDICNMSNCDSCSFCATGTINLPSFFKYGGVEGGLGNFLNNIFILISVGAGLFALFNFFIAGYTYISAKDDKEKIEDAMAHIVNSLIGLLIIVAAFLIAALAGQIFFGDAKFILQPKIYGPEL